MEQENKGARRAGRRRKLEATVTRDVNYRQLRNPFPVMSVFSDDEAANMHQAALSMLEELGMKVLLPEARDLFRRRRRTHRQ